MNFNSRVLGILSLFLVLIVLVSSASAIDYKLSDKDFDDGFKIGLLPGTRLVEDASGNISVDDINFTMKVFANAAGDDETFSSLMYFKDSSSSLGLISDVINDLKKEGNVIEENDSYIVIENPNAKEWISLGQDVAESSDNFWGFADGFFSSDSEMNFGNNDSGVHIGNDGITVNGSEGDVSLSTSGFNVSSADGDNVSISSEGVKISGNSSNESVEINSNIDSAISSSIEYSKYVVCVNNKNNDQLIVLYGNDLDLLKTMAESVSFKEK